MNIYNLEKVTEITQVAISYRQRFPALFVFRGDTILMQKRKLFP